LEIFFYPALQDFRKGIALRRFPGFACLSFW